MGNIKSSDYCYTGDLGIMSGLDKTNLTGCIGEIIGFHRRLTDEEILYIHEYLMKKWGIADTIIDFWMSAGPCKGISQFFCDLVSYYVSLFSYCINFTFFSKLY